MCAEFYIEEPVERMSQQKVLRPRLLAAAMYLAYIVAAAGFLFLTATGIRELLGEVQFILWNGFWFGGATISCVGALVKRYRIEIIGHPFLISAFAVYALYLILRIHEAPQVGVVIGIAFTYMAAALGMAGRLIEIYRMIKLSNNIQPRLQDE